MIRILVVDDHPVVREGYAAILATEPDFTVVGQAGDGHEALRSIPQARPDVVLLDMRLPGMSGVAVCKVLARDYPQVRILVLTSYPNKTAMVEAHRAGAHGFLGKTTDRTILRKAVRTVAAGGTMFDTQLMGTGPGRRAVGPRAKGPFGLTTQEMRVLELVPKGLTNVEIAKHLGISPETVKSHLAHAMRKLQVRDRTEAGAVAIREGLA